MEPIRRLAAVLLGAIVLSGCGSSQANWYANGKAFALADDKAEGHARLVGPVGIIETWCSGNLRATTPLVPAQRPSDTSGAAGREWIRGCEAGYREAHPDQ